MQGVDLGETNEWRHIKGRGIILEHNGMCVSVRIDILGENCEKKNESRYLHVFFFFFFLSTSAVLVYFAA